MLLKEVPLPPTDEIDDPDRPLRAELRMRAYDRMARRRILIAVGVSLVVNAIVFGYAGVFGHQFILMLRRMESGDPNVTIRRVVMTHPPVQGPDFTTSVKANGPKSAPRASSEGAASSPSVQAHP